MDLPSTEDVKNRIQELVSDIAELERELEEQLRLHETRLRQHWSARTEHLQQEARAASDRVKLTLRRWLRESDPRNVLSAPIVYSMIVPIALLDLAFSFYQAICFPLYRVAKIERGAYIVLDRHKLAHLNVIEKFNCVYCGYANGVLAYATAIGATTEQYWCPIKHAHRSLGAHERYARFLDYDDSTDFRDVQTRLRAELEDEKTRVPAPASDPKEPTR